MHFHIVVQIFPTDIAEGPIHPGESRGVLVVGPSEVSGSQFNLLDFQVIQHSPKP
jgi:hypothetical protein